jgi:DNA-binding CsgD family transcriptional regulator
MLRLLLALQINLFFFATSLFGERLLIKTYTVADGLLRDNVYKIKQDSRGFLWFCTDGMGNPNADSIFENAAGEFFVTFNKGSKCAISRFNGEKFDLVKPAFPPDVEYFGWGWKLNRLARSRGGQLVVSNRIRACANGYLLKNTPPARLLEALKEAVDGGCSPMSPTIAARVVKLFRTFRPPESAEYYLTPQETELLKLLVEGHHKKTAAREMKISVHTVSFHLKNNYRKLQVHSMTEAVAKALRERLV